MIHRPSHRRRLVIAMTLFAATPVLADADGALLYATQCAGCHQANGTGIPGAFPPLAGSEWVHANEAVVIQIVLHGVQGPLTVRGTQYNMSMPAFGAQMSDAEIAAVATYVRSQWGNKATQVTPQAVAKLRAATDKRTTPWSEAELMTSKSPSDSPRSSAARR